MKPPTKHNRGHDELDAGSRRPGKLLALVLLAAGLWLGAAAAAQAQKSPPAKLDLSRTHLWLGIDGGAPHTDDGRRAAGFGVLTHGWGNVQRLVREAHADGISVVWLRGPSGGSNGAPMDFAADPRERWTSAREMADAIRPLIAEGIDIRLYYGSLPESEEMAGRVVSGDVSGWLSAIGETVRPAIDAGVTTICFDHVGGDWRDDGTHGERGTPAWGAVRALQAWPGLSVYGEPHGPGAWDLDGCVTTDEHWRRASLKKQWREMQNGEIVRLTASLDAAAVIQSDGHSAALYYGAWRQWRSAQPRP